MIVALPWAKPPLTGQSDITFAVPGEPMSKPRPRMTRKGQTYTPKRTKDAEARVAAAYLSVVRKSNGADYQTAFALEVEFHLKSGQRRDIDNMLKLLLDGLNGVAWADDSQVIEVVCRKVNQAAVAQTLVRIGANGRLPSTEGTCSYCGQVFPRPPSHWKKKHCSQGCRQAENRETRKKTCAQCGEPFVSPKPKSEQQYCSRECSYKARHIDVTCVACGASFTKARSLNRSGNAYCSDECKATYWRDHRKSAAKGTCADCGGPTTKKTYKRCQDCHFAAGGRWAS